jgi:flagellar operon protein (TIGR03826 family)
MSPDFRYCSRCGKLFARTISPICGACHREIEEEYQRCYKYLRENRGCTLQELSEETGVSTRQIAKFIQEGRISLSDAPNLAYPCESCGAMIREHKLCADCRSKLTKEVKRVTESAREEPERRGEGYRYKGSRPREH